MAMGGWSSPKRATMSGSERLVYVAAACPRPGERLLDHARRLPRWLRMTGDGRMTITPRAAVRRFHSDLAGRLALDAASWLLPSTAAIVEARAVAPAWLVKPTTYVRCTRDRVLDGSRVRRAAGDVLRQQLAQGRADGFDVTLPTGHSPFASAPRLRCRPARRPPTSRRLPETVMTPTWFRGHGTSWGNRAPPIGSPLRR